MYDASKTTSTSLADNASKDVHGATVIDANNSEYGDIFIDIEGAKTLHVNTLGQELIESKTLQEGGANDESQEALSQMFGGQLEKRVDQATGNQLGSTSTAEFSNSLANSQSVFKGTQKADKVGDAKVDYYLTQTEAQRKVELTDFLLRCTSADCRATDEFISKQRELVALNKTDTKRDEDYKSACQNGGGADCNLESAKVVEAFNTYDKDVAVRDGTLSEYLDVSTKYGESESRPWEVAATDALMEMPSEALLGTLESAPELVGLAVTAASALAGDEQAQQQLEVMYLNIKGTISDPDGALDGFMADIAAREASGEITSHEAKKEVAKFYISVTTAVAGQIYGLVKVGGFVVNLTRGGVHSPSVTENNINSDVNVGDQAGFVDVEFGVFQSQQLADFKTFGLDLEPKNFPEGRTIIEEYQNAGLPLSQAEMYAKGLIESGSTVPVKKVINEPLFKIVSSGTTPSDMTPYWFTKGELENLKRDPIDALNKLGIPLQSHAVKFDVYEIKPKGIATVFESKIAPTQQGSFKQSGGATQTLVTNRSQFTDAKKTESIALGE